MCFSSLGKLSVLFPGGAAVALRPVRLVVVVGLLPLQVLAFEVLVAGELHGLQALLGGLVRVGAVGAHAVAPRAVADAHAGGEHEDLLAHHALVLFVLLVHLLEEKEV